MMKQAFVGAILLALVLPKSAPAAGDPENQPTQAGIQAVETHWQKAFTGGDVAYLDRLLVPYYVSVSADGAPRDREAIERLASTYAKNHPTPAPVATDDTQTTIRIEGTTAVVTSYSAAYHQRSVDVFAFKDGEWRALYSQHTTVK